METRARYTMVGAVVVIIVAIFLSTLFWLSRTREQEGTELYLIFFRRFSLAGLQINSAVTMRGINVGIVEDLRISPRDIELVRVLVRLRGDTPVKEDTEAVIERNLLTGLAGIDLVGGTQEAKFLSETPGEEHPVIPEGRAALSSLQDNLPQLLEKVGYSMERLDALLSEENIRSLSQTLANLKAVSDTLAQHRAQISNTIDNAEATSRESVALIRNLNKRTEDLTKAFTHVANVVSLEVGRAGQAVSGVADSLRTTMQGYQDPAALLRGRTPVRGPGEEQK